MNKFFIGMAAGALLCLIVVLCVLGFGTAGSAPQSAAGDTSSVNKVEKYESVLSDKQEETTKEESSTEKAVTEKANTEKAATEKSATEKSGDIEVVDSTEEASATEEVNTTEEANTTEAAAPSDENIKINIPDKYFLEKVTQESLNEEIGDDIISATLGNDGSVTYVMTPKGHEDMKKKTEAEIEDSLSEMITSGDYPTFKEIEHNSDFTEFTVKVAADDIGMADALSAIGFIMLGEKYAAYSGEEVENVSIQYVNATSGDLIQQVDSKDLGE